MKRRKERETVKQRDAEPEAPAIAEEPVKRRKEREAVKQRDAEPEAPAIAEEPVKRRKERETAKQRDAEPEAPVIAEEPVKRRKERETVRQRDAEPDDAGNRRGGAPEDGATSAKRRYVLPKTPPGSSTAPRKSRPDASRAAPSRTEPTEDQPATARAERLPESDAAAQAQVRTDPVQVGSIISEEGRRIERPRRERPEVPEGAELVREVNNRFIFQTNNTYFIERPREERFIVDAREVYYEELPRSRQREVVIRPDGTRIVTIRNR